VNEPSEASRHSALTAVDDANRGTRASRHPNRSVRSQRDGTPSSASEIAGWSVSASVIVPQRRSISSTARRFVGMPALYPRRLTSRSVWPLYMPGEVADGASSRASIANLSPSGRTITMFELPPMPATFGTVTLSGRKEPDRDVS
jgi:hypothetical protein